MQYLEFIILICYWSIGLAIISAFAFALFLVLNFIQALFINATNSITNLLQRGDWKPHAVNSEARKPGN